MRIFPRFEPIGFEHSNHHFTAAPFSAGYTDTSNVEALIPL